MVLRDYDPGRDREAARRIWLEVGWLEEKDKDKPLDSFIECGRALVAEVHNEAECLVLTAPGAIRYLEEDLPLSCVTGVTTSRVARKMGLASRLTAKAVAADAAEGALVSALGMFEQGYYNRIGFGTGGYEHWVSFNPAHLHAHRKARVPRRITAQDGEAAHTARLARLRGHGGCNVLPVAITNAEMQWSERSFGLGYFDGPGGELTHYLWGSIEGEHGPGRIDWIVYRTADQFLELMAVLASLGDQVNLVRMREPQGIQMQDMIRQPFMGERVTEKTKYETGTRAHAYWQARICDLRGCLERTHLPGETVRFNLNLSDSIEAHLEDSAPWRGVGGEYVVTLGPDSSAKRGYDAALPTLTASVDAFTRMWLGVRPASGLAVTDELSGPPELLSALDRLLRLPDPKPDWDF
jgi:hypothetical protein